MNNNPFGLESPWARYIVQIDSPWLNFDFVIRNPFLYIYTIYGI